MTLRLLEQYSLLLSEIALHAKNAGRDPASIQFIAVTKYANIDQMQEAYQIGIRDFGESRLQAALPKMGQLPQDIRWHYIGALQSNKIAKIVEHFDFIHSVDSLENAELIAKKSQELNKRPSLFLQVNTSLEKNKKGFLEDALIEDFDRIIALELNFIGLMTMAPLTIEEHPVKNCFRKLRLLRDKLSKKKHLHHLSMGMSQDFPIAIAEGATFLRIGSHLFEGYKS